MAMQHFEHEPPITAPITVITTYCFGEKDIRGAEIIEALTGSDEARGSC
jgi:hypothetical protein